jgi:hypothetical protein
MSINRDYNFKEIRAMGSILFLFSCINFSFLVKVARFVGVPESEWLSPIDMILYIIILINVILMLYYQFRNLNSEDEE